MICRGTQSTRAGLRFLILHTAYSGPAIENQSSISHNSCYDIPALHARALYQTMRDVGLPLECLFVYKYVICLLEPIDKRTEGKGNVKTKRNTTRVILVIYNSITRLYRLPQTMTCWRPRPTSQVVRNRGWWRDNKKR